MKDNYSSVQRLLVPLAICAVTLSTANATPQLSTYISLTGVPARNQTSTTASSLSDSASNGYGSESIYSSHGSASAHAAGAVPTDPLNPSLTGTTYGTFITRVEIDNLNARKIRVTYHLSGQMHANGSGDAGSAVSYQTNINNVIHSGATYSNQPSTGEPIDSLRTFTVEHGLNTDFALNVGYTEINATAQTGITATGRYNGGSSASSDVTLTMGAFFALDSNDQPVDYTSTSASGSARGYNVVQGQAYGGFALTNTAPSRIGSTLSLLDGAASAAKTVTAHFTAPPEATAIQLASDAVELQGTDTDLIVIQINYSSAAAAAAGLAEASLRLGWLNLQTGTWVNAVLGNSGGTPTFFNRAYNPATDFHLGYFGVDTTNKTAWAVVNHNSVFGVAAVPDAIAATALVSRKTHGSSGTFDIPLNLSGTPSVECRSSGGNHTLVFTFNNQLVSGNAEVTSGVGSIAGGSSISGNTMTIPLTGVVNAQRLTVTLRNVTDTNAQVLPDTAFTVGFLVGDTNGNGSVTSSDIGQAKAQSGQPVTATNFRSDVTANGGNINASDIGLVKSMAGTQLPP